MTQKLSPGNVVLDVSEGKIRLWVVLGDEGGGEIRLLPVMHEPTDDGEYQIRNNGLTVLVPEGQLSRPVYHLLPSELGKLVAKIDASVSFPDICPKFNLGWILQTFSSSQ